MGEPSGVGGAYFGRTGIARRRNALEIRVRHLQARPDDESLSRWVIRPCSWEFPETGVPTALGDLKPVGQVGFSVFSDVCESYSVTVSGKC